MFPVLPTDCAPMPRLRLILNIPPMHEFVDTMGFVVGYASHDILRIPNRLKGSFQAPYHQLVNHDLLPWDFGLRRDQRIGEAEPDAKQKNWTGGSLKRRVGKTAIIPPAYTRSATCRRAR